MTDSISPVTEPTIKYFTKAEAIEYFGKGKVTIERTFQRDVVKVNGVLCMIEGHKSSPKYLWPPMSKPPVPKNVARNRKKRAARKLKR